jgi:hypothetical protein
MVPTPVPAPIPAFVPELRLLVLSATDLEVGSVNVLESVAMVEFVKDCNPAVVKLTEVGAACVIETASVVKTTCVVNTSCAVDALALAEKTVVKLV